MDSHQKLKYEKSKYLLKKWESEFRNTADKLPTKTDIKCAPKKIKEAYKTYWTLKKYFSGNKTVSNIHEDENAKDCFNSSSETVDGDTHFKNGSNLVNSTNILDDSISLQAILDTVTETKFDLNLHSQEVVTNQKHSYNCDHVNKKNPKEDIQDISLNELTPTSFKNLFNKESRSSLAEPLVEDSDSQKTVNEKKNSNKFEAKSLSFQYAEKLFAGSKFNKRNPRKPRSFSSSKKTEIVEKNPMVPPEILNNGINKTDAGVCSLLQDSNDLSSFPQYCLISNESQKDPSLLGFNEKFKIITQTSTLPTQAVSLLQRSFDNSHLTKLTVSRTVDKGWLERVNEPNISDKKLEANLAESQDSGISVKTDSLSDSINNTACPESKSFDDNYSSDDLIYDSDCETQNQSLCKLNLLDNLNRSINLNVSETKSLGKCINDFTIVNQQDNTISSDKRRCLFDEIDDMPLSKRLKSDNEYVFHSVTKPEIIVPYERCKRKSKTKLENFDFKQELLERKLASGDANKNFVKINIEKKRYARGKKTMTFSKYKKKKWKEMKRSNQSESCGVLKCYKCGDIGHFSKACPKKMDALLPLEEYDSFDDSPFPTLEEAAEMAKEAAEVAHKNGRKLTMPEGVGFSELPIAESSNFSANIQPLFKLSTDGSIIDTPQEVYAALKDLGHNEFRPGQEKGIMRILSGLSTVVTLSTGSGKSLIYQLPAYMYNKAYPGCITLVISPLVSLMEDQVFCGSKKLHAVCLHHNLTQKKRDDVLEALKNQSVSILLIAPESLSSWDSAKSLFKLLPPIAFACIDEAHSISQHSHNFRPSYLTICQVLREKMGISTLLGLTATASVRTLETVMSQLGVDDASSIISDIPLPDNLQLSVSNEYDKREALLTLLHSNRFCNCDSIIIYCTRREECDSIAAFLRTSLQEMKATNKKGRLSVHAEAYHAGLTAGRRNQVQSAFISGNLRIVVATVAFGMGINKVDIRGIIHFNMPSSFECYVQEIGRAGRDKKPAQCHLFLDAKRNDLNELRRHIYADTMDRHTIRKMLQLVFIPCDCGKKISCKDITGINVSNSRSPELENRDSGIVCCKHEVAFPIESTIISLDLPQEVISTLLAYLQLDKEKWIKVLPLAYTKCKVTSYKGVKYLKKIARSCAPLAVIIAEEKNTFDKAFIEFDIMKLARKINWDSGTLKQYLKQLEWITVEGKAQKSGILVEFSCLGFRVLAPGDLTDIQLDQALNLLHSKVTSQEEMRIKQLSLLYELLKKVAHSNVNACCNVIDEESNKALKDEVRKYFSCPDPLAKMNILEDEINEEIEVASDIRRLISMYRSDNNFTGRNIARILHGIGSPNFPPIVWGRTKFWRLHLDKNFNSLVILANKQLILMR